MPITEIGDKYVLEILTRLATDIEATQDPYDITAITRARIRTRMLIRILGDRLDKITEGSVTP